MGKGRSVLNRSPSLHSTARYHTSHPTFQEAGSGSKAKGVLDSPRTRAQRQATAASEIRSLYERSASKAPVEEAATAPAGFKINRIDPSSPPASLPSHATAPSSLKEALRRRALERDRQPQPRSSPTIRSPSLRGGPSTTPNARRPSGADPRPKGRDRASRLRVKEASSKGEEFVGHTEIDHSPEAKHMRLQEAVLLRQKERRDWRGGEEEEGESMPEALAAKTQEEEELEAVMGSRAHKATLEDVVAMPTGVNGEVLGPGLVGKESVDRLLAMAERRNRDEWVSLQDGEEGDVQAFAERMKIEESGGRARQVLQEKVDGIMGKWVGGMYGTLPQDEGQEGEVKANILNAIMANKSYTPSDQDAFMAQFEMIVGTTNVQPKGKVADAVKANAREAAMSKEKRAPNLR